MGIRDLFKSKDRISIEREAKEVERDKLDTYYTDKINKLRKTKDDEREKAIKVLRNKYVIDKQKTISNHNKKVKELKAIIVEQKHRLELAKKAWLKYKDYAFKLSEYTESITSRAKFALDTSADIYRQFDKISDQLDMINTFNDKNSKDMIEMLHINEEDTPETLL